LSQNQGADRLSVAVQQINLGAGVFSLTRWQNLQATELRRTDLHFPDRFQLPKRAHQVPNFREISGITTPFHHLPAAAFPLQRELVASGLNLDFGDIVDREVWKDLPAGLGRAPAGRLRKLISRTAQRQNHGNDQESE